MSCRLVGPGTFKSRRMSEKKKYKMGDSVIQWSNLLLSRAFGFQSLSHRVQKLFQLKYIVS